MFLCKSFLIENDLHILEFGVNACFRKATVILYYFLNNFFDSKLSGVQKKNSSVSRTKICHSCSVISNSV
jgi:hypothetical protein